MSLVLFHLILPRLVDIPGRPDLKCGESEGELDGENGVMGQRLWERSEGRLWSGCNI